MHFGLEKELPHHHCIARHCLTCIVKIEEMIQEPFMQNRHLGRNGITNFTLLHQVQQRFA